MHQHSILLWTLIFLSSIYILVADIDVKEDTFLPHGNNDSNVAPSVVSVQTNQVRKTYASIGLLLKPSVSALFYNRFVLR